MPAISVIMPCYNRGHDLPRILRAYERQEGETRFEVIAVDDRSADATYEVLTSYCPTRFSLRVERLERNQGPAAARNRGISMARAPLILFVGDDIAPAPGLVAGHVDAHRRHPGEETAILGRVKWAEEIPQNTLMIHIAGVGAEQFSYFYLKDGHEYDFRHFYTANISLKKDFLTALDRWFDTDFPYAAFEDVELAFRLSKSGLRIVYSSALLGHHYHYHTIWSFSSRQYYSGRMTWVLVRKHPGVAPRVFRAQYEGLLQYGPTIPFVWPPNVALQPGLVDRLEAQTLHLTSFYEWRGHDLLDALYSRVLSYFYFKGLIEGIFGVSDWTRRLHVSSSLLPSLRWFLQEAQAKDVPLPEWYDASLLDRLTRRSNAAVKPGSTSER